MICEGNTLPTGFWNFQIINVILILVSYVISTAARTQKALLIYQYISMSLNRERKSH